MQRSAKLFAVAALLMGAGHVAAEEPDAAGVVELRGFVGKDQARGHLTAAPTAEVFVTVADLRLTAAADLVLDQGDGDSSFAWSSPYLGVAPKVLPRSDFGELELGATIPLGAHGQRAAALGLGTKLLGGEGFTRFRTDELSVLATHRAAFGRYPMHFASEVSLGAAIPVRDAGELSAPLQASLEARWSRPSFVLGLRASVTAAIGRQDPHVAAIPTLQVPVGSVALGVSATVNLGGELGSTFTGAPWSVGLSLEVPPRGTVRGRIGQCSHDLDCANGYVCRIVAACDECEGGPMRCVKDR